MTRTLWILAVVTLAFQLAVRVFGGVLVRTLAMAGWSPLLLSTTTNLAFSALIIVTAGAGIYVASRARRGGWVALFGAALVLALYGPTAATVAMPRLGLGRAIITYLTILTILDFALEVLVPLLALVYTLRYRRPRAASMGAI